MKKELEALTRGRTDRFSTKGSIKHHKYLPLIICSFKFTSAFVWPGNVHYVAENVSSCECFFSKPWPCTLAYDLGQRTWPRWGHDELSRQMSRSKVILFESYRPDTRRHTNTHTEDRLHYTAAKSVCKYYHLKFKYWIRQRPVEVEPAFSTESTWIVILQPQLHLAWLSPYHTPSSSSVSCHRNSRDHAVGLPTFHCTIPVHWRSRSVRHRLMHPVDIVSTRGCKTSVIWP